MSSTQHTKKIALVDCNSFYVSCERLFKPSLIRKPVIVLSSNDGCIISRSNEAKALGIKMGDPYFKAKEIIKKNNVHVFSSNYSLYGDMSRRVMKTLKYFGTKIEVYDVEGIIDDIVGAIIGFVASFGVCCCGSIVLLVGIIMAFTMQEEDPNQWETAPGECVSRPEPGTGWDDKESSWSEKKDYIRNDEDDGN